MEHKTAERFDYSQFSAFLDIKINHKIEAKIEHRRNIRLPLKWFRINSNQQIYLSCYAA